MTGDDLYSILGENPTEVDFNGVKKYSYDNINA
jgi:hypothetical protein